MGRNSILEQLRQQSIERMRQERVTRLHRERKDRPIILEAEKKQAPGAIVVPQAAAASAAAAAGGGSGRPDVPPPPVQTAFAFKVGLVTDQIEEPGADTMPWNISSEGLDPFATIGIKVTRNGEVKETDNEIIKGFTWNWEETGEPGSQQTTLEIPKSQNNALIDAGVVGTKAQLNAQLVTAHGAPIPSVNSWEFGTIFRSVWGISLDSGQLVDKDLELKGTQHLSSLQNFSMNDWTTDEVGIGVILSLNGNNTTDSDNPTGLSEFSVNNVFIKKLSLNNLTSYAHGEMGNCQIQNCTVYGPVNFGGSWKTKGEYNPAENEPGFINIAGNFWQDGSSVSLAGLWSAYVDFSWVEEGTSPLSTFNLQHLRTAYSITLNNLDNLTSVLIGNVNCPNLTQLNLGLNSSLINIGTLANLKAPILNQITLEQCFGLTTQAITDLLGGLGTALNAGNIGTAGTLDFTEVEVDITGGDYQIKRLSVTDPEFGAWNVIGDFWAESLSVMEGEFTTPQETFEAACLVEPGEGIYYSLAGGEPFAQGFAVMDDDQGNHGLSACYVKNTDGVVHRYYPQGDGEGSNIPAGEYVFWIETGSCE